MDRKEYKSYLKKADNGVIDIADDLNPAFILSGVNNKLISQIIKGEINIIELAKREMEKRGLDFEGNWVGFNNENKYIRCFEDFKLTKNHYREKAKDAYEKGILDDLDMDKLNSIYSLVEQGRLFDARNIIITIEPSLKPYVPDLPETKVSGDIKVRFEIKSDMSIEETEEYIKNVLSSNLEDEGQIYRYYPDMDSLRFDEK